MTPSILTLLSLLTLVFSLPKPTTANIPLTISLALPNNPIPAETPLSLTATTTNPSSTPLTFLRWTTPLEPLSAVLGVYTITDRTTNTEINTHLISVRRAMPPPPEDFVQLNPGQNLSVEVRFDRIELVPGHEYDVRAEGWWSVVWEEEREAVLADEAKAERLEGGMTGWFESKGLVFRVASE